MTNLQKFYKLTLNLLDCNPTITSAFDPDKKEYEIGKLDYQYGEYGISVRLDLLPMHGIVIFRNSDGSHFFFEDEMDTVIQLIKQSYIYFLLEGIEWLTKKSFTD